MRAAVVSAPLLAALVMLATPARAAMIFIDANDAPTEIEAAHAAAQARGEQLIVLPEKKMSPADKKKLADLLVQEHVLEEKARKASGKEEKEELRKKRDAVAKERETFQHSFEIQPSELQSKIQELKKNGQTLDTLILSGHSRGMGVFGSKGHLSNLEIETVLKATGADKTLRSVFQWGCYTGTASSMRWWNNKARFPNLDLVAGFKRKAAASSDPVSPQLLKQLLVDEASLRATTDVKKIQRKLAAYRLLRESLSMSLGSCFFDPDRKSADAVSNLRSDCTHLSEQIFDNRGSGFDKYFYADQTENAADPPPDGPNSPLQKFYDFLQENSDCLRDASGRPLPTEEGRMIDKTLALRHSHVIQANFQKYYKSELTSLRSILGRFSAKYPKCASVLPPDFGSATRRQVAAAVDSLLSCEREAKKGGEPTDELGALDQMAFRIFNVAYQYSCVDVESWILTDAPKLGNPGATPGCEQMTSQYIDSQ